MTTRLFITALLFGLLIQVPRAITAETGALRIVLNHRFGAIINDPASLKEEDYAIVAEFSDQEANRNVRIVCLKEQQDLWQGTHLYFSLREHLESRYLELINLGISNEMRQELNKRKVQADLLLPYAANVFLTAKNDPVFRGVSQFNVAESIDFVSNREANSPQDELLRAYLYLANLDFLNASKAFDWSVRIAPEHVVSRQARSVFFTLTDRSLLTKKECALAQHFCIEPRDAMMVVNQLLLARIADYTSTAPLENRLEDYDQQTNAMAEYLGEHPVQLKIHALLSIAETLGIDGHLDQAAHILAHVEQLDRTGLLPPTTTHAGSVFRDTNFFFTTMQGLMQRPEIQRDLGDLLQQCRSNDPAITPLFEMALLLRLSQLHEDLAQDEQALALLEQARAQLENMNNDLLPCLTDLRTTTYSRLAALLIKQERFPEARKHYHQIQRILLTTVETNPAFTSALSHNHYELGRLLFNTGDADEEAVRQFTAATQLATQLTRESPVMHTPLLARSLQLLAETYERLGNTEQVRRYYDLAARSYATVYRSDPHRYRNEYLHALNKHTKFHVRNNAYGAWRQSAEQTASLIPLDAQDPDQLTEAVRAHLLLGYTYFDNWDLPRDRSVLLNALQYTDSLKSFRPANALYLEGIINQQLAAISMLNNSFAQAVLHNKQVVASLNHFLIDSTHRRSATNDLDKIVFHYEPSGQLEQGIRAKVAHAQYQLTFLTLAKLELPEALERIEVTRATARAGSSRQIEDFEIETFLLSCIKLLITRALSDQPASTDDIATMRALGHAYLAKHPKDRHFVRTSSEGVNSLVTALPSTEVSNNVRIALKRLTIFVFDAAGVHNYLSRVDEKVEAARLSFEQEQGEQARGIIYHILELLERLPDTIESEKDAVFFDLVGHLANYYESSNKPGEALRMARDIVNHWEASPTKASARHQILAALSTYQLGHVALEADRTELAERMLLKARDLVLSIDEAERTDGQLIASLLYMDLAKILQQQNKEEETSRTYAKSLVAFEAWREKHPDLYLPRLNSPFLASADFFLAQRDFPSAIWTLNHANTYFDAYLPFNPETAPLHLDTQIRLAKAYDATNQSSKAIHAQKQALSLLSKPVLSDYPDKIYIYATLSAVHARSSLNLGIFTPAAEQAEAALQWYERCNPQQYPNLSIEVIRTRKILAQAFLGQKKYDQAEEQLSENIILLRARYAENPDDDALEELVQNLGIRYTQFNEQNNVLSAAADLEEIIGMFKDRAISNDNRMDYYLRSLMLARETTKYPIDDLSMQLRNQFVRANADAYRTHPVMGHMIRKLYIPKIRNPADKIKIELNQEN